MWKKAGTEIFFYILFWKGNVFLMEVKIKYKQQPPNITDYRSALFSLPNHKTDLKIMRIVVLVFLIYAAFLFVSSISRDSFFQYFLEPSTQSFSVKFRICLAFSWSHWSASRGRRRAVPTTKQKEEEDWERGRTLKFSKWQCQQLSVFLALPMSSSSQVTAEPVPVHSNCSQVWVSKIHQQRCFQIRRHQFATCCLVPKLEQFFCAIHLAMSIIEKAECCQPLIQWHHDLAEGEGGEAACISSGLPAHCFREQEGNDGFLTLTATMCCTSTRLSQNDWGKPIICNIGAQKSMHWWDHINKQ